MHRDDMSSFLVKERAAVPSRPFLLSLVYPFKSCGCHTLSEVSRDDKPPNSPIVLPVSPLLEMTVYIFPVIYPILSKPETETD